MELVLVGPPSPSARARARPVRCGVPALALSFTVPFSRSRSPAVPRGGAFRADTHRSSGRRRPQIRAASVSSLLDARVEANLPRAD